MLKKNIIFALPLITLIVFVAIFSENVPHQDDICNVDMFEKYHENTLTIDRLFKPHNQHLMPLANLIFLVLGLFSGFNIIWYLYASILIHTIGYVFILLLATKSIGYNFFDPPYWMLIIPVLHFNLVQFTIFVFGFNLSYILPLTCFYGALFFADNVNSNRKGSIKSFILSMIFIILGIFSSAMGYLSLLAVFILLIFKKDAKYYLMSFIIFTFFVLLYVINLVNSDTYLIVLDINKFQKFFFELLGFPVYNQNIAYFSGIFTFTLIIILIYVTKTMEFIKSNIVFLAIASYSFFVLLFIAYGRHNHELSLSINIRYNAYLIPLYISSILILISIFKQKSKELFKVIQKVSVVIAFIVFIISSLVVFYKGGPSWNKIMREYACILINSDDKNDNELKQVFPNKEQLLDNIRVMKKYNLSLFSEKYYIERFNCYDRENKK